MAKRGRPAKTIADLPANWREQVITLAKQGVSDFGLRGKLGLSPGLWYSLLRREREFRRVIKRADETRFALWLRQGRIDGCLRRPGFNSKVFVAAV